MEPITIAIICAAVFGVVATLSAFIHQLILSRDKKMNDLAQERALAQETKELEKLRIQMSNNKRFDSHYQILGSNKDAIQYIDQKIEENLKKKSDLISRYAQVAIKESSAIISGEQTLERKAACDRLKEEIDNELKFYDSELIQLQNRRANLWDAHTDLQDYLLDQEKKRNKHLDNVYKQHSNLLEKIYIRHNENSEHIAKSTIEASTSTFKSMMMAPINFLLGFFKISSGISLDALEKETEAREDVEKVETDINGDDDVLGGSSDVDNNDNTDVESDEKTPTGYRRERVKVEI